MTERQNWAIGAENANRGSGRRERTVSGIQNVSNQRGSRLYAPIFTWSGSCRTAEGRPISRKDTDDNAGCGRSGFRTAVCMRRLVKSFPRGNERMQRC